MAALPTIDFKRIRAHEGSQNRAFEELCFQLLRDLAEIPPDARIVRHGTPDGGVEFLVELPEGGKWGWQAKYLFRISDGALSQLDGSVRQALTSHPDLTRYTFCLPYNRPAGATKGRKSARRKWEGRVEQWSSWARERGMEVDFVYLGESELLRALTGERHAGRVRYWFGQDVFTRGRLRERLAEALESAGPRYTREVRVDLPIAEVFDGLCRSPRYLERLRRKLRQVRERQKVWGEGLEVISDDGHAAEIYKDLQIQVAEVNRQVLALDFSTPGSVELPKLLTSCTATRALSTQLWHRLDEMEAEAHQERSESGESRRAGRSLDGLKSARWSILRLEEALEELESLAGSDAALAVNTRSVFVVGEAGSGKTHLLCDVGRQRIEQGHPAILLFGQHFAGGDLWHQILQQADFAGRPDEFLGALEAAAQASGGQALLCIDALNEAGDLRLWENHVAALLERVRRFPWVSIALSCRTSYEEDLLPADRFADSVVRVEHRGFASKTQEAVRAFFRHYGLAEPDFPLTLPELGNPLFLKLMCISLSGMASPGFPRGLTSVTSVFQGFLGEAEKRLAKRCDYSSSLGLVQRAVETLAQDMLDADAEWVPFERAMEVSHDLLEVRGWQGSLLKGLIDEGVLTKDKAPRDLGTGTREVVRFAYQRLGDHMCASSLCGQGLAGVQAWLQGEPAQLLDRFYLRSGWLDALAVQLSERFGVELHEVAPEPGWPMIQNSFLQSLVWRSPGAIELEPCLPYLREISSGRDRRDHAPTLDALLEIAVVPGHPFNARFLHDRLVQKTLAHRDAFWSIYVHGNSDEASPLGRLVSWAETGDVTALSEEGAELAAITLTWCLSTPNRRLRDRATKALVRVLGPNLKIVGKLLHGFGEVSDPYILERLLAAIYGAVLTCKDQETLGSIARLIYSKVFAAGQPPVHLLIRDYASGIVEWALEICGELEGVDPRLVRPPYDSPWPVRALKLRREFEGQGSLYRSIRFVIMEWDFRRKVIEPAVRKFLFPNQSRRRSEEKARRRQRAQEQREAFVQSLTPRQLELLEDQQTDLQSVISVLVRSLNENQRAKWSAVRHALHMENQTVGAVRFDTDIAARWIANRVVALGWRPVLFAEFEEYLKYSGRRSVTAERISEKYQRIALQELLARLADHCNVKEWGEEPKLVQGVWELNERDIDPALRVAPEEEATSWPSCQLLTERIDSDEEWVRTLEDCTPVERLIAFEDPEKRKWLALESYPDWWEGVGPELDPWSVKRRRFWFHIRSYLVRKADEERFLSWAAEQRLFGRWMPESFDLDKGFLGEHPWHPATHGGHQGWTRAGRDTEDLPVPLLVTACRYHLSSDRDHSLVGSVKGLVPNAPILHGLRGRWSGEGLRFVDESGRLVAWDPSSGRDKDGSPSCLLVDADCFLKYLADEDLTVVWTVLGEKLVLPGDPEVPRDYVRGDISGSLFLDGQMVRLHSLRLYGNDPQREDTSFVVDSLRRN